MPPTDNILRFILQAVVSVHDMDAALSLAEKAMQQRWALQVRYFDPLMAALLHGPRWPRAPLLFEQLMSTCVKPRVRTAHFLGMHGDGRLIDLHHLTVPCAMAATLLALEQHITDRPQDRLAHHHGAGTKQQPGHCGAAAGRARAAGVCAPAPARGGGAAQWHA